MEMYTIYRTAACHHHHIANRGNNSRIHEPRSHDVCEYVRTAAMKMNI